MMYLILYYHYYYYCCSYYYLLVLAVIHNIYIIVISFSYNPTVVMKHYTGPVLPIRSYSQTICFPYKRLEQSQ